MSNQTKLDQTHSQLNDRASWLFTHIAATLLGYAFDVAEGAKGAKTTLQREVSYLPANFKLIRDKVDAAAAPGVYVKTKDVATVYAFNPATGKLRTVTRAEWDLAVEAGHRIRIVSHATLNNAPKESK